MSAGWQVGFTLSNIVWSVKFHTGEVCCKVHPVTLLTLFYFLPMHDCDSVFVVPTGVFCKSGLTCQDAIWQPDRRWPMEPSIRWEYIYIWKSTNECY